jgi:hypothetical protein
MILLNYELEKNGDMVQIKGHVEAAYPNDLGWLQLRKFELKAMKGAGGYSQLFSDAENIKTVDAALFVDKAFSTIMKKEKLRVLIVEEVV